MGKPKVRHFHPARHTAQEDGLGAPVELVGFAGAEDQGDIGLLRARMLHGLPVLHPALDAIVGPGIARLAQILKESARRPTLLAGQMRLGLHPLLQNGLMRPELGLRRGPAIVLGDISIMMQILVHRVARHTHETGNLTDGLLLGEIQQTNLGNRFHAKHSRFLRAKSREGSRCSVFDANSCLHLFTFAR